MPAKQINECYKLAISLGSSLELVRQLVSSPATPPKKGRGERLGALAKFLGCADVAFSIPELPIRSTRRAFT